MFHFDLCQSLGITHELEENMEPSASSILIYMLNQKVKMNLCHVLRPVHWPRNKRQPGEFFFFSPGRKDSSFPKKAASNNNASLEQQNLVH